MTIRSGMRVGALLVLAGVAGAGPAAAQTGRGDTVSRRPTAAELQAVRREWLERQRTGGASGHAGAAYGSARVGVGGRSGVVGVGPTGGYLPEAGIPVQCEGVLIGPPGSWPGAPASLAPGGHVFRGQCVALGPAAYGSSSPGLSPYGATPFDAASGRPFGRPSFDGVTEYGPWGFPLQRYGWSAGPGAAYGFTPWPGVAGGECARLQVATASGVVHEVIVSLRSLGVADPADLDLAIDARLSRGQAVDLPGIDGRWIRLEPGAMLEDVRVFPCAAR